MPLLEIKQIRKSAYIAIWKIEESVSELETIFSSSSGNLTEEYHSNLTHEGRKRQWLSCRILAMKLCHLLGKEFFGISKNEFSKPFLINLPFYISFSHTKEYATTMLQIHSSCGIDIEKICKKMQTIQSKFLNSEDLVHTKNNRKRICMFWSAKEALYKWHGKKKILFKEEINIQVISKNLLLGRILQVKKSFIPIYLWVKEYENHILVHTL